jgi:RHH-type proline utilization regulon transcriptional repressor/proline dehydrogenase/delta 1-pyrroline-5-carboxylate dehydrogenase
MVYKIGESTAARPAHDHELDRQIIEQGRILLAAVREKEQARAADLPWLDQLLEHFMADEDFRVQALRFVDVLPVLESNTELVKHLREYFPADEFPLPGAAKWGLKLGAGRIGASLIASAVHKSMGLMGVRFLGGTRAKEVLATVTALRQQGIGCSLDLLGEESVSEAEADEYLQRYLELLDKLPQAMAKWQDNPVLDRIGHRPLPRLNLSVKLSSLYSQISTRDLSGDMEAIAHRLRPLLRKARQMDAAVCIDMEHYDFKGVILGVLRQTLMEDEFRDWPDVAIALQAYLRDAEQDLQGLIEWAKARGTPITVRLVRGAYWDQECIIARREGWPIPVWSQKAETDACYERCLALLMGSHPYLEAAVATHNMRSMATAMVLAEQQGLGKDAFEFQMLFGMGQPLAEAVAAMGYRMRIYTPFGELLPGMAYLVRRLLENSSSQSYLSMMRQQDSSEAGLLAPVPQSQGMIDEVHTEAPVPFRNEPVHRFTSPLERERFGAALESVRQALGRSYPLVINGREVETGRVIRSCNPARPQEVIGEVASAGETEAVAALAAAEIAFASWSVLPMEERADYLRRAAAVLRSERDQFAAWAILEAGKPWVEADGDVAEAIDFLEYYAEEAQVLGRPRRFDLPGETNALRYRARGVGVVIPPWNFPLAILVGMTAAAIVTGNTVILKPSSQTPVIAARFMELLQRIGLPNGVVNLLPGPGGEVGEFLVRHPRIHYIAFTGSQEVGTRIAQLASELAPGQMHIKRVIAEMGGKNAIIVDSDGDPDAAVRGVISSAFGYAGQKCSACSRVILVGGGNRRFEERLLAAARSLRLGPPEAPGTFMGPVIEAAARDRICQVIEKGKTLAKLALQLDVGQLGDGYYVGPAIFTGVSPDSFLAQEEIFGPVLSVMSASSFEQALEMANATRYALTGGVYSRSPSHLELAARYFAVGNLYLNRGITGARVGQQPFGGFKLSGMGTKAGGPDYLLQFVEPSTVTENTLRKGYAPEG